MKTTQISPPIVQSNSLKLSPLEKQKTSVCLSIYQSLCGCFGCFPSETSLEKFQKPQDEQPEVTMVALSTLSPIQTSLPVQAEKQKTPINLPKASSNPDWEKLSHSVSQDWTDIGTLEDH